MIVWPLTYTISSNACVQMRGRRVGAVWAAGAVRALVSYNTLLGGGARFGAYDPRRFGTYCTSGSPSKSSSCVHTTPPTPRHDAVSQRQLVIDAEPCRAQRERGIEIHRLPLLHYALRTG